MDLLTRCKETGEAAEKGVEDGKRREVSGRLILVVRDDLGSFRNDGQGKRREL
jgi:hypothetical protein